jgi:hypothetical protein
MLCTETTALINFLLNMPETGNAQSLYRLSISGLDGPFPISTTKLSLLQNNQTGSRFHPALRTIVTGMLSRGSSDWDLKLTTHPYLISRLRINGAIPLLRLTPLGFGQGLYYVFHIFFIKCLSYVLTSLYHVCQNTYYDTYYT